MRHWLLFGWVVLCLACNQSCALAQSSRSVPGKEISGKIIPGAERLDKYIPSLRGRRVALFVNHTSRVGSSMLPDTLIGVGIRPVRIFVPEHGFRGTADAGAHIDNEVDTKTGLPVVSLYGKNKKPALSQLEDVDIVVYDLQDVGVRFYTYISSLEYMMEACAEAGKELMVLDRPDPNGDYVDGPVLDKQYSSFVGMQSIPVVYGMTPGEYARMLAGERWVKGADKLKLTVIPCAGYDHKSLYELPVPPSPNLRTAEAIRLYPSVCFFEGTVVSLGRGTDKPFMQWGHPAFKNQSDYSFTPKSTTGASKPPLEGEECFGKLLTGTKGPGIDVSHLLLAYQWFPEKDKFFTAFFEKLAGTSELRRQVITGLSAEEIRKSWKPGLEAFKEIRKKYLLYPDFE